MLPLIIIIVTCRNIESKSLNRLQSECVDFGRTLKCITTLQSTKSDYILNIYLLERNPHQSGHKEYKHVTNYQVNATGGPTLLNIYLFFNSLIFRCFRQEFENLMPITINNNNNTTSL